MNFDFVKIFIAGFALLASNGVFGEGVLIKADPKDNAEINGSSNKIKLWFSGNVSDRKPSIVVVDSHGNRVDNNDTQLIIDDRSELSATTRPLQAGRHVVRYRVVTEDGLIVSGILKFTVKN